MVAFYYIGRLVVASDLILYLGDVSTAFGKEYYIGALEVAGRLAQDSSRQHVAVAERIRGVHKNDLYRMFELLILEAVVKYYGVATKTFYRIASGLYAVAIHDNGDSWKVRRKHVRLVAAGCCIKKHVLAVRDD